MPQKPVKLSLTAKGELRVTRNCAIARCETKINAPARFCADHWAQTPTLLRQACVRDAPTQGPAIDHPTVLAIVAWWAKND